MTFKTLLTHGAATLALALSSAAFAQEATQVDTAPEGVEPGPALWQLSDEDTTVYLFGTVHVLPEGIDWYDDRIERAFTSADELVFEIDLDNQAAMQQTIISKATLEGDRTLRDLMSEENRAEYEAALQGFGMPTQALDQFEPWMAAMTLSLLPLQASGYDPQSGVEMALRGQAEGKERAALETVDEQIALFDTLPMDAQLDYLDQTVEAIPDYAETVDRMVSEWAEGDAVTLAEIMNEEMDDPELYQRLLTDRNANWADWLEQRMDQPGTVFVAVGAGHLAGEGSVQRQLEDRGIDVTRVWE